MELLTLFLLSTALVPVSSSPARRADRSEPFHLAISTTVTGGSPAGHGPSTPTVAPAIELRAGNGAAVEPVLDRREALNIGDPNASPADTVILHPWPGQACTTTLSETFGYPCSWDGTSTMYPSTTVLYQQINCNGCSSVYVSRDYYYCPNQSINATLRAGIPSTYWSTICQQSAGVAKRTEVDAPATTTPSAESGAKAVRSPEDGVHPAACPTTLVVQPVRSAGKTATTYASFTTTTSTVNCGGRVGRVKKGAVEILFL
ncbi:hypothetical protein F5144DRAFT_592360 [Chaetomium tenue]|uniref:Uncharacterized protein n=1 Tax=Chaetomium tenue TaxID=1854479 RepID=A0ACB7PAW6_9PEZI|nr:hypothetical protein F5144DRAFT_592360 [Chaetomium globosum]